nr:MAG TPA_asm: hypothetical protein [Caudoviricetes sp.]
MGLIVTLMLLTFSFSFILAFTVDVFKSVFGRDK